MATQQDYARLRLFVDTTYQVQTTSCELVTNSGQQRVDLMNEGLGGFTPGSGDCTLNIGFAIPVGGQAYPWQQKAANGDYVAMQVVIGAEQYSGTGKLMDVTIGQSANANAEGSATWVGELKPLK